MPDHENPGGRLPHVVRALFESPWAIEPHVLAAIREIVLVRANGETFSDEEIEARIGAGPAQRGAERVGSVALVPIHGVIFPKANLVTEMSGGTSIQKAQADFRAALADDEVTAVVLDVNSPGGVVDMIPEFAAEIRSARAGKKPVVAVSNTKSASAALWLASQAGEFVASPSAEQGSIGVFAAHEDWSKAEEMEGIKTTLVSAGRYKTVGSPFSPLSDSDRAIIQERIDESYAMFTADVARGRRVPVEEVRRDGSPFGEGKMLSAKQALKAGLVDRVATLEQVVAELQSAQPKSGARAAEPAVVTVGDSTGFPYTVSSTTTAGRERPSFTDEADALHDSARRLVDRLTSLAEVERGHLTVAKRDRLTACTGALREVTDELDEVLAATDPDKHRKAAAREAARLEHLRMTSIGGR